MLDSSLVLVAAFIVAALVQRVILAEYAIKAGPFELSAVERATVRAADAADLVTQRVDAALDAVAQDIAELKTAGVTVEGKLTRMLERIGSLEGSDDELVEAVNSLYAEVTRP